MGSKKVTRLTASFVPEHYEIFIDPDRSTKKVYGEVTLTGRKQGRPSQRITLHQHGLTIISASITKHDKKGDQDAPVARINHHRKLDEVRLHTTSLLYPGMYTVKVVYTTTITDSNNGIYPCTYEIDGQQRTLIATDLEPHHARDVLPCIDEPEAKATFRLTLATPPDEVALSNTPPHASVKKNGKLHTTFERTPRMSTYLLCFVYGDLQCRETKTQDGVIVRAWSTKVHPPQTLDYGLDVAVRGITFFNEYYGVPYPLAKCDLVALPDFSAAAMENWGIITFREQFLLADPKTSSQSSRELTALVINHELSHQWFGDLVTMRWWNDLWLNESFANVMEYVATEAAFPDWHVWNMFTTQEGLAAFRRDAIAGVQAIKTDVHHPDEINSIFDPSIVYAKGGRLLRMLMQYLGETDFRAGLKRYFQKHAYGNTTGDDLWAALGAASNKDIASFMNPWLEYSGFPVVRVDQNDSSLTIEQSHFVLETSKADPKRVWPIPLLATNAAVPELLTTKTATITLPSTEFVRINQKAVGHYIVHYANPAHTTAIANLVNTQKLDQSERLMLLSDSALLARGGVQSFADTLRLLQHYADEDSEPVWGIIATVLADCRRFIDSAPELEKSIKKMVRELLAVQYKRLGWDEQPHESVHDTKLRATILGLGVYAEHPDIAKQALRRFDAYKHDASSLAAEIRGVVFGAAVRQAHPGAFDYLLELEEKTTNVDLKHDLMAALASTHSTQEGAVLLARIMDPQKVRQHDIISWVASLLFNRYTRAQAWTWVQKHWDWIEKTLGGDRGFDYFPRASASAFNTRKLMDEYTKFFLPKRTQTSLKRNITIGIEELESRIAWIERDLAAVEAFFT